MVSCRNITSDPTGIKGPAADQPGLADMTLKAIDILKARDTANDGFFMMAEAASIDKMFHVLDYERALGELLELDNTIRKTIEHLEKLGIANETLIVVTADHGEGVWKAGTRRPVTDPEEHLRPRFRCIRLLRHQVPQAAIRRPKEEERHRSLHQLSVSCCERRGRTSID